MKTGLYWDFNGIIYIYIYISYNGIKPHSTPLKPAFYAFTFQSPYFNRGHRDSAQIFGRQGGIEEGQGNSVRRLGVRCVTLITGEKGRNYVNINEHHLSYRHHIDICMYIHIYIYVYI